MAWRAAAPGAWNEQHAPPVASDSHEVPYSHWYMGTSRTAGRPTSTATRSAAGSRTTLPGSAVGEPDGQELPVTGQDVQVPAGTRSFTVEYA
ncbi:hypothetical protein [Streptomyces fulvoviolaceus]|uniref:hypothetical protein n=2 Tax=Streptomyces fulvoviolaceus TaxID=285535 RepID=UPI0021C1584C|nr:hypothetical protein [Streptomyces fulvoviolaceus]MCT9082637.1 hypothetical protein [Streptomyces fulvoviolaceus]